jgi:hypothetical protein
MLRLCSWIAIALCLAAVAGAQQDGGAVVSGTVMAVQRVPETALPRVRVLVSLSSPPELEGSVVGFSEWEGLWTRADRYRVGQTISVRLYPVSQLGLTSTARQISPSSGVSRRMPPMDDERAPNRRMRPSRFPRVE